MILIDPDGPSGSSAETDFVRLEDIDATKLTAYNLNAMKAPAVHGTQGDDTIRGSAGNDVLDLSQSGEDRAFGGEGNDIFFYGAALTGADSTDGGFGIDTIVLQGLFPALALGASSLFAIEGVSLQIGSVTRWGRSGRFL